MRKTLLQAIPRTLALMAVVLNAHDCRTQETPDSIQILVGQAEADVGTGTGEGLRHAATHLSRAATLSLRDNNLRTAGTLKYHTGLLYFEAGASDSAFLYLRQALPLLKNAGERGEAWRVLDQLAFVHFIAGSADSASFYFHQALATAIQDGDSHNQILTLVGAAGIHQQRGEFGPAGERAREALSISKRLGDRDIETALSAWLGFLYRESGQLDSALVYSRRALLLHAARGGVADGRDSLYFSELAARGIEINPGVILNNIGLLYFETNRLDSAQVYLREGIQILRQSRDESRLWRALANAGDMFTTCLYEDSALAYRAEALRITLEIGDRDGQRLIVRSMARWHGAPQNLIAALAAYRTTLSVARDLGEQEAEAAMLADLGGLFRTLGHPDSTLVYLQEALPDLRAVSRPEKEVVALRILGDVYHDRARFDSALGNYYQALVIAKAINDRLREPLLASAIGHVYEDLGRADSAFYYYRWSLERFRADRDQAGEMSSLYNIASVYDMVGRTDSALAYYSLSLALSREESDLHHEGKVLWKIGWLYLRHGDPKEALTWFYESLRMRREAGDHNGEEVTVGDIASAYQMLSIAGGNAYSDSAAMYLARSLELSGDRGNLGDEAMLLGNLASFYQFDPVRRDLQRADSFYSRAAVLKTNVSDYVHGDQNRIDSFELDTHFFTGWMLLQLDLYQQSGETSTDGAVAALAASERGRTQALLRLTRSQMPQAAPSDLVAEGRASLTIISDTQASAALYYAITPSSIVTWLLLPTGEVYLSKQAISEDSITGLIERVRHNLAIEVECDARDRESEPVEPLLGHLYAILLPSDLRRHLPSSGELLIVPHGILNLVPFAALRPSGRDPLGLQYALRYAPSLAVLRDAERRGTPSGRGSSGTDSTALIVGNPAMPRMNVCGVTGFIPYGLEWADSSSRYIARLLNVQRLTGSEANEREVQRRMPHARIIHLATHGYALTTESQAHESFIALAPVDSAGIVVEDGRLTVDEILNELPELKAELVVLAACQTGLGDLKRGEGSVGLQRALLSRHARTVLVSLWSVDDEATAHLMQAFYRNWANHSEMSKAEALRRAQREVFDRGWTDPRYWAGFQLVGAR